MKLDRKLFVGLTFVALLAAACPKGESTSNESLKAPPGSGAKSGGSSSTTTETEAPAEVEITASDIEAAVEEAAGKINETNADAELDALEKELGDH